MLDLVQLFKNLTREIKYDGPFPVCPHNLIRVVKQGPLFCRWCHLFAEDIAKGKTSPPPTFHSYRGYEYMMIEEKPSKHYRTNTLEPQGPSDWMYCLRTDNKEQGHELFRRAVEYELEQLTKYRGYD